MKILLIVLLLLVAVAAVEYGALRRRANAMCYAAQSLALKNDSLSRILREAAADPFLGDASLEGPPSALLAYYRDQSRQIGNELSSRFLPVELVSAFRNLALTRGAGEGTRGAVAALKPSVKGLECRGEADEAEERLLEKLARDAEVYWGGRRELAEARKLEFRRDREIFCRGEGLLRKLKGVVEAAAAKCRGAVPGSKLALSCASGGRALGTESVRTEIEDLERRKEINLRKLRGKWPSSVVEGIQC